MTKHNSDLLTVLERIALALEALSPKQTEMTDFENCQTFVWQGEQKTFSAITNPSRLPLDLIKSVERAKAALMENTLAFAKGLNANNALLWGARGTGKSSLIKATHGALAADYPHLKLIEIHREDLADLPRLMELLQTADKYRFLVFCDDLSFEGREASYKSLKVALDGGLAGRPKNVLFYATSNRRHLLPRDMIENEQASAINPGDAIEESVSLSDRFGLWLGFHRHSQDAFLGMIESYIAYANLDCTREEWLPMAIEWSRTRGDLSGRVAWQFFQDLCSKKGHRIDL